MAGGALAQDLPPLPQLPTEPDVNLTAQTQSTTVKAGECVTFSVTVFNQGEAVDGLPLPLDEEVHFDLSPATAPSGWRFSPGVPDSRSLERGDSTTVQIGLCADDASSGDSARVTLQATLTNALGEEADDSVALSATVEQDQLFGIPWDFPPWILWVVLIALGVMLASVVLTRKKGAGGVTLSCEQSDKEVLPGRGTSFPLKILNESRSKDVVSLTTSPVPHGWDTFLPIVDVPLEAGDEQTVWISVKSPDDAPEGAHVSVKVWARSSASAGEQASLDLSVTVRRGGVPGQGGQATAPGASEEPARSVYGPEDDDDDARAEPDEARSRGVAFKRRKA